MNEINRHINKEDEVKEFWTLCEACLSDGDCDKCEMCKVIRKTKEFNDNGLERKQC